MTEPVDMEDLLSLELSGVKVVVKEPGTMNRKLAGEYGFYSRQIFLRRAIVPYWFATLLILLHEYGHHRQRGLVCGCVILTVVPFLGSWVYDLVAPSSLSSSLTMPLAIAAVVVVVLLKVSVFEALADRYAKNHVPDIFLFLSDLELVEIVDALENRKTLLPRSLGRLHRNMKKYSPQLLTEHD